MSQKFVRIVDVAAEIGLHPNSVVRKIQRSCIEIHRTGVQRNSDRIISIEDYQRFVREFGESQSRIVPFKAPAAHAGRKGVYAFVYAFGKLLKIGWSEDVDQRIAQHRTLAVDMDHLKVWLTAYSHDEANALDIAKTMLAQRGVEVFEIGASEQVQALYEKLDQLFALLGRPRADE